MATSIPPEPGSRQPARRRASLTAAAVARVRARLDRPASAAGDTGAGRRLAHDLRLPVPIDRGPTLAAYMRGRTRYFDDVVLRAVAEPGQVVLVGAGYDDRSLRFRTPGVQFVEVDHPATQADKRQRLDRLGIGAADVRLVALDLEHEAVDAALDGVVDATLPTVIVVEAVVPYLSPGRVEALFTALARVPGRPVELAVDVPIVPVGLAGRTALALLRLWTAAAGEPVRTVLTGDELDGMLRRTGWHAEATTTGAELGMPASARALLFVRARPTAAG